MRFAGERRHGERGEEGDKQAKAKSSVLCTCGRSLVYVHTRMIPSELSEAAWRQRMAQEDLRALTPLLHDLVNP
jgi:TnpA family transposase